MTVAEFKKQPRDVHDFDWDKPYDSAIHIVLLWDQEHALDLEFRDSDIVSANEPPFRLEAGILRFEW